MRSSETHPHAALNILCIAIASVVTLAAPVGASQTCTYSGRAFAAFVRVLGVGPQIIQDTGELPPSGGSLSSTLLLVDVQDVLHSETIAVSTEGVDCIARSLASQENVAVLAGQPAEVRAAVVEARTQVDCGGLQGTSVVLDLTFGGDVVTVTGEPNQTVTIPGVATLVINERLVDPGMNSITVNALHLLLDGGGGEVIVSSAHSDLGCAVPGVSGTWGRIKVERR